jgi:hypothetical protein
MRRKVLLTRSRGACFGLLLLGLLSCFASDEGFGGATLVKGLVAPFRKAQGGTVAVLRVDRIFSENEKHGFLRIGILSHIVCEGVTINVQSPLDSDAWLQKFSNLLSNSHDLSHSLELRRLRIVSEEFPEKYLDCLLARPQADGTWNLTDVHWMDTAGEPQHLSNALLVATSGGLQLEQDQRRWCVDFSHPVSTIK